MNIVNDYVDLEIELSSNGIDITIYSEISNLCTKFTLDDNQIRELKSLINNSRDTDCESQ